MAWRLYKTPAEEDTRQYYCARYRRDGTVIWHRDGSSIIWRWGEAADALPLDEVEARKRLAFFLRGRQPHHPNFGIEEA